jgi:hypothetical protein
VSPVLQPYTKVRRGTSPATELDQGEVQKWPYVAGETAWDPSALPGLQVWLNAWGYGEGGWDNWGDGPAPAIVGSPNPVKATLGDDLPVVRFAYNEGRLRLTGGSFNMAWTVVYVARMIGSTYGRVLTSQYPPCNLLLGFWNGYQDVCYDAGFTGPNTQTPVVSGQWKLYSGDGTAAPLTRFFGNGVLFGTTPTSGGWGGALNLSGYDAASANETCDCEVRELCMWDRQLSDSDRGLVEAYMRTTWGLAA